MSFIVIDGPNGAGKTTIVNRLAENGYDTLSSPNGTPLAQMLRPACRGTEPWKDIDKGVQFMLFSAARLDEYIRRVHNNKKCIIADRWWTSTVVYQCWLQGLSEDYLSYTIHPEEKIDLVICLDGSNQDLIDRVLYERKKNPEHGNCKWTKEIDTMNRLIELYRKLPEWLYNKDYINNVVTINTSRISIDKVYELVENQIKQVESEVGL